MRFQSESALADLVEFGHGEPVVPVGFVVLLGEVPVVNGRP